VARVNDVYLFKSDLLEKIPSDLKGNDSIAFVQNYINQWAKQQLLLNGANQNLSDERLEEFDALVEQYKNDLYSNAYLEALISRGLDTIVNDNIAQVYYTNNSEAFRLNEDLVKLKYITVNKDINSLDQIKTKFRRYNKKDKADLERLKIQFKSYALNDSVWVRSSQVLNKLPVITIDNKNELLKKSNFIELTDSIDLYLVQIKDVLMRGDIAPLNYVRPTINQIVVNKRKVDLLKKIETDITKDAIKNKKFEIFN
tara:strand:- start:1007 stop:1774 length:768 start_codon:yes stop_codon:yes gene_type:complete